MALLEIPLHESFEALLDDHPEWLIYIRADRRFPCRHCYNEHTLEGDPQCRYCLGTGHVNRYQKVQGHSLTVGRTMSLARPPLEESGYLSENSFQCFFRRSDPPARLDLLCDVEWTTEAARVKRYGKPASLLGVYQINLVRALRWHGEIAFFSAHCRAHDFHHRFLEQQLLTNPDLVLE